MVRNGLPCSISEGEGSEALMGYLGMLVVPSYGIHLMIWLW